MEEIRAAVGEVSYSTRLSSQGSTRDNNLVTAVAERFAPSSQ